MKDERKSSATTKKQAMNIIQHQGTLNVIYVKTISRSASFNKFIHFYGHRPLWPSDHLPLYLSREFLFGKLS